MELLPDALIKENSMFRFYLEIPLIQIHTELLKESDCIKAYTYIAWNFKIWKWSFTLYWGKEKEKSRKKIK